MPKRYLVGNLPGPRAETVTHIGMALEGDDEDVLLERCLRIIKQQPAACWQVTTESPFGRAGR